MATSSISSSGQFINIDALVQNAVSAQQSRVSTMQSQKNSVDTKISALGQVKSQVSSLNDKFQAIAKANANFSVTGAPTGLSVTGTANGNYAVSVDKLASGQIATTSTFGSGTGALGYTGTLKIDLGSYDGADNFTEGTAGTAIQIEATDTLKDIQNKLNASGQVNVSIINGSDGQHLSFSSKSIGADQGFKITASDTGNGGLNAFNFSQSQVGTFTQNGKAQDASATVNGVTITSKNNTFTGVQGLSFTATQTSTTQNISVQKDNTALTKAITDFVSAYNTANTSLKANANVDNQTKGLGSSLRAAFSNNTDFSNNLSQIGLSFDKSGSLTFDSTKLTSYANNGDKLTTLLNNQFGTTSKAASVFSKELNTGGILDSTSTRLTSQSSKLADSLETAQDVLKAQQTSYRSQFAALDSYLSTLNDSSNTVTQLMAQFNKSSS